MNNSVIQNDLQYREILRRVDGLLAAEPQTSSPEGLELTALLAQVKDYEDQHYPIPQPN
jgi:antitoxin component HigA of HigAB toxin-antitoxin module